MASDAYEDMKKIFKMSCRDLSEGREKEHPPPPPAGEEIKENKTSKWVFKSNLNPLERSLKKDNLANS